MFYQTKFVSFGSKPKKIGKETSRNVSLRYTQVTREDKLLLSIIMSKRARAACLIFDYINTRHPNIRFTMEKKTDKKLPFLDILRHDAYRSHYTVLLVLKSGQFITNQIQEFCYS